MPTTPINPSFEGVGYYGYSYNNTKTHKFNFTPFFSSGGIPGKQY